MNGEILVAFILTLITVVHGACQQDVLQKCMMQMHGSTDINIQCKQDLPTLKACIDPHRESCKGETVLNIVLSIEAPMETICAQVLADGPDCSANKMMTCAQQIQSLASREFEGFPTSEKIEQVCPKMRSFKMCISPIQMACEKKKSSSGRHIAQAINAAVQIMDLICGEDMKDFLKYGKECFDKPIVKNITYSCKMRPSSETRTPIQETQQERCNRTRRQFDCYSENVGRACSNSAVEFVKKVKMSFYNIIAKPLGCPIGVVHGACQQDELQKCMTKMSGATDMNTQCNKDLPALKACIDPHRESCKGDTVLNMVLAMETPLETTCAQFSGDGPDCALMSCQQMTPYAPSKSDDKNKMPQATPELCQAFGQFKTCVATQKAKGNCDANMLENYNNMISGYELLCSDCNANKMMTCAQQIQSLASKEFEGYPTSEQIQQVCPKMNSFKTCISPIQMACQKLDSQAGRQITQGINAAVQMVDLICGGDLKDDFVKYGKECFDKPAFKNVTKMCVMFDKPDSSDTSTPKQETQEEMCSRIRKQFDCYSDHVGKACSDATVDFVKEVEVSFYNIIAEPLSCPIGGSSQLMSQIWLLVAVLIAGIFLF